MTQWMHFELELLEDAVLFGASGRGGEAGLDFVPGAALLGAAASRIYGRAGALAWDLFHSGRTRFSDARLLDAAGGRALVAPRSLHLPKGMKLSEEPGALRDFTRVTGDLRKGMKPLSGQLFPSRRSAEVATRFKLRTAVGFETQQAAESRLFGYHAIAAGQRFGFTVATELDGHDARQLLEDAFAEPILIGRSRSAECGRARVRRRGAPFGGLPLAEHIDAGRLCLLLESEMCLLDLETGGPTFTPRPEHFGLPGGQLLADRSFIRTTRWTPFNGKRRRPDAERCALLAGSVLAFSVPNGFDLAAFRERAAHGFGLHRAEGLGQVVVHPKLFASLDEGWTVAEPTREPAGDASAPVPSDALGRWLAPRIAVARLEQEALKEARALLPKFRRFRPRRGNPSRSQWNQVRGAAQVALLGDPSGLFDALFQKKKGVLCNGSPAQKAWGSPFDRRKAAAAVWGTFFSEKQMTKPQPHERDGEGDPEAAEERNGPPEPATFAEDRTGEERDRYRALVIGFLAEAVVRSEEER